VNQNLIYYTISGTVIGGVMQWAGMSMMTVLFGSFMLPPVLLLLWRIARYKNLL